MKLFFCSRVLLLSLLCVAAAGAVRPAWATETTPADDVPLSAPEPPAPARIGAIAPAPYNRLILEQIAAMPEGGGYAGSHQAKVALISSVQATAYGLSFMPERATPSFCSGATYLVFLKTVEALRRRGEIPLDGAALNALLIGEQRDGQGVWGRWNANGPGTARLFYEMRLGPNFNDFTQAQPGDFMKIFWSTAVGRKEHGHSVVYLGTETVNGVENVRFWSSNVGMGYGAKSVPRSKIAAAVFSRLLTPANLARAAALNPLVDPYLASLLTKDSNLAEVQRNVGMLPVPKPNGKL